MCETMKARSLNSTIPDDLMRKMSIFGEDIAAARKVRQITQAQLAEALNVSRATVNRLEAGDHKVGFGLVASVAWMMGLEDKLLSAFSPDHDPVAKREQRLSLPERVRNEVRSPKTEDEDIGLDF